MAKLILSFFKKGPSAMKPLLHLAKQNKVPPGKLLVTAKKTVEKADNSKIVKNLDNYIKKTGNKDIFTDKFLMERQSIANAGDMDLIKEWAPSLRTRELMSYIKDNVRRNVVPWEPKPEDLIF